jgi:hypothetical protein
VLVEPPAPPPPPLLPLRAAAAAFLDAVRARRRGGAAVSAAMGLLHTAGWARKEREQHASGTQHRQSTESTGPRVL